MEDIYKMQITVVSRIDHHSYEIEILNGSRQRRTFILSRSQSEWRVLVNFTDGATGRVWYGGLEGEGIKKYWHKVEGLALDQTEDKNQENAQTLTDFFRG